MPLDSLLAVLGRNPYAEALNDVGPALSDALAKRAAIRKEVEQVGKLETLAGQQPGSFKGLPLSTASALTGSYIKDRTPAQSWVDTGIDPATKKIVQRNSKDGTIRLVDNPARGQLLPLTNDPGIQDRADSRMDAQRITRINNQKNRMINDPRIKPLYSQGIGLGQVGEVVSMAQSGNTIAANALGVKMAKGMGEVGVLTDQDVSRYVTSGRIDRKAADILSKWVRGVPSDATMNEINQIAAVLRESFSEKVQPIYNEYIESFSEVEGMTPDEVSKKMAIPYKPTLKVPGRTEKPATHRWNPATGKVEPI